MNLPFDPPLEVMLAVLADAIPTGPGWVYEPKWDGFRSLVFLDEAELFLQSRDRRPFLRYFPELEAPLRAAFPPGVVVDGELVVAGGGHLDFEALQTRLHPAASRVAKLAREIPVSFVAFDLLAHDGVDLRDRPFAERRAGLEAVVRATPSVHLSPTTSDPAVAAEWFRAYEGAGLDGIVAKRAEGVYTPGKRTLVKVKHTRTADCVVAGFRWFKGQEGRQVGSLVLGLYDDAGRLRTIGVASGFSAKERASLAAKLEPYRAGAAEAHPWTGAPYDGPTQSRWSPDRDLSFEPLRLELVVEVAWGQLAGGRFRHPARVERWREDKPAAACRMEQLVVVPADRIEALLSR